jgi:DNA-binding transcriptional MerR regulator
MAAEEGLTLKSGSRFTLHPMRIAEVAEQLGVPPSTVRYYERIGLVPSPPRTPSGYRNYDDEAAARLLFVIRAKRIGLTLDQIAEVLPIWNGVNCAATHDEITRLIEVKKAEVHERMLELQRFAEQLDEVRVALAEAPPPAACLPDLSCCVPEAGDATVTPIAGIPTRRSNASRAPA